MREVIAKLTAFVPQDLLRAYKNGQMVSVPEGPGNTALWLAARESVPGWRTGVSPEEAVLRVEVREAIRPIQKRGGIVFEQARRTVPTARAKTSA